MFLIFPETFCLGATLHMDNLQLKNSKTNKPINSITSNIENGSTQVGSVIEPKSLFSDICFMKTEANLKLTSGEGTIMKILQMFSDGVIMSNTVTARRKEVPE